VPALAAFDAVVYDSVDYVEDMLKQQLIQAIGKRLLPGL
jgi:hypothetical protein